jgi:nucleotide-binding universal stress UspA family protein
MKIVVGYDGSEHAKRALERAAALAHGDIVYVVAGVHVTPPMGRGGGSGDEDPAEAAASDAALDEAKAILSAKGVGVQTVKGIGDPAKAIVEEAEQSGAELIVVGSRGLNIGKRLMLGSVSTDVIHHAPCDVLVVK